MYQLLADSFYMPIVALSIIATLYTLGIIVYRVTFHPLAKYPGPWLGKITDWYSVIRSVAGDRHIHFLELHNKYGPFVRFGPNRISVNTAEGLQKIYGTRAPTQKSRYYDVFSGVFKGDSSLTTIDHGLHMKKKRVVSTALSESSVKAMEEIILRNIRKFTVQLGKSTPSQTTDLHSESWSSPKNMTDWADYLSFDIMGDICFSSSFGMLDGPDNRYILNVLPLGVNGLNITGWMPWILRLKLGNILFAKLNTDMKRYEAFANEQSSKRLALENSPRVPDVYSYLLESNKSSKEGNSLFSPHDLVGESSLLITGGSDTTATAISATFFYLLHNPPSYEKLKKEIRPRFSSLEEIRNGGVLQSCRWLRACIDEAMRMSPGVPGLLPRVLLSPGVEIAGNFFAEGVDLGVSHYAIHHNEDIYPDSFSYQPERWLVERYPNESQNGAESRVELAKSGFCPFSIGQRGCVGKGLAMKELMVTIARAIWLYDLRLMPGEEHRGCGGYGKGYGRHRIGEYQLTDMFVSKTDGPIVQFRRRV
ncbi:cytochrome P450-like protein [Hypoxylon trugodes]|uniref:cytochrome P450-like protein n=1 Tax=Hypoxylon trugodes TaxID=326681 RepID=UPI0021A12CB8|nr:cytochrome P450-like protein [Hypoxylon trugodes]KAI1394478.1 cytochrome P450-like protein [Hypoxylon trugodes]